MTTIVSIINNAVLSHMNRAASDRATSVLNLASGLRSNAGVADYSVGTILANQASALRIGALNAGQGKSLLQTADAALDQIVSLLQDQKALAVQATDSSLSANELAVLNQEFQAISTEINRIVSDTKFNGRTLLDGSISGTASVTSATGLASENYSILSLSNISLSGTVASGELATSGTFNTIQTDSVGDTKGTGTLVFTTSGIVAGDSTFTIDGGAAITFGDTAANATAYAAAFVAAAKASEDDGFRSFVFTDNEDGTVTVTAADKGTTANALDFTLATKGTNVTDVTFGTVTTFGGAVDLRDGTNTAGTNRDVDAADITIDTSLQGAFSNFTATLSTANEHNEVTFTVDVNGTTYTSDAVTLFGDGDGEFNGKGDAIRAGQVIVFTDLNGPTDASGEYTNNSFSLTVGGVDITIVGASQTLFETDLTATAQGFLTQLNGNRINQSRDVILPETNASGGDFTISTAPTGTTFAGIEGFDAIGETLAKGDIQLVSDSFGPTGLHGRIGNFSFSNSTDTFTVTIDDEVFTADISDSTANTGGLVNGTGGSYDSATNILTVGSSGTTIVFHSAATNDGRQLRLDLSNLTDKSIELNTTDAITTVTGDLDTLFGVDQTPSLSFQVGQSSTNTIAVSVDSVSTTEIYRNDAGTPVSLDLLTNAQASVASDVLDNAINTVLSVIATVGSGITSFTSAIVSNNLLADNAEASSATLLYTDFARESTALAEATLRLDSGIAVLAQNSTRTERILSLLGL